MKLLELEIHNFRGIKDLTLAPEGRNCLIQGPNGSGKSSVIDALDFLLTGRVSRLTGQGAGDLSLEEHGPHVDAQASESWVRGRFQVPTLREPVTIRRTVDRPSDLQCETGSVSCCEQALRTARNGLHLLTRRNMLKFIASESSTRAQQIQQLLDLSDLEAIRSALVRVENELTREEEVARTQAARSRGALAATIGKSTADPVTVLEVVNQCRGTLGGSGLSAIVPHRLKEGLAPPTIGKESPPVSRQAADQCLANLCRVLTAEFQEEILALDTDIREAVSAIRDVPAFQEHLRRIDLLRLGLGLIDDTGVCPLCDYPWPPGELQRRLRERLEQTTRLQELVEKTRTASTRLQERLGSIASSIQILIGVLERLSQSELAASLRQWLERIQAFSQAVAGDNVLSYSEVAVTAEDVRSGLAPDGVDTTLRAIRAVVEAAVPETPPEQAAWDLLTRVEENLKAMMQADTDWRVHQLWRERASVLRGVFERVRERLLTQVYESVRDEFVLLYRALHGEDEGEFSAQIVPRGSGLDFRVDFYRRGLFPPHALHSEGHQDTMGLCLFLALNQRLAKGSLDLVILDDVMMSVDRDHRRKLCELLSRLFGEGQVLITTHDSTWARQLVAQGLVKPQHVVYFRGWDIAIGPQLGVTEQAAWSLIDQYLQRNDVRGAAAQLRWYLEMFYSNACALLQARVVYRPEGRWDLGDVLPAACRQLREWMDKAERAARSWGRTELGDQLREVRSVLEQAYQRSHAEEWSINPNVHYRAWEEFAPADLRPVVEAFHDLEGSFRCGTCRAMLSLAERDRKPVAIKCRCGAINWSLEARG